MRRGTKVRKIMRYLVTHSAPSCDACTSNTRFRDVLGNGRQVRASQAGYPAGTGGSNLRGEGKSSLVMYQLGCKTGIES